MYANSPEAASDPLVTLLNVQRQVVGGLLFVVVWDTASGKQVKIKVHIRPWMSPEQRYSQIDNQITIIK